MARNSAGGGKWRTFAEPSPNFHALPGRHSGRFCGAADMALKRPALNAKDPPERVYLRLFPILGEQSGAGWVLPRRLDGSGFSPAPLVPTFLEAAHKGTALLACLAAAGLRALGA
jgi:hypothetical protein